MDIPAVVDCFFDNVLVYLQMLDKRHKMVSVSLIQMDIQSWVKP